MTHKQLTFLNQKINDDIVRGVQEFDALDYVYIKTELERLKNVKKYLMITLVDLKAELEPFKNTLVIDAFHKVVRLVDVVDGEHDYYWVYDSYEGIYRASCVGEWIPLKGFIEQAKYDRMVHIWNLNNIEKAI